MSAKVNTTSIPESELTYQWQRLKADKLENINGATEKNYTPTASDVGKYIRLTVSTTRENCEGTLNGGKILVGKAPQDKPLSATLTTASPYTFFTVKDFDRSYEYVYTTDAPKRPL